MAAAKGNNSLGACGIATGCRAIPIKVADSAGNLYFSALIDAMYYAADNGCDIASMSQDAAGAVATRLYRRLRDLQKDSDGVRQPASKRGTTRVTAVD
jgi:subtilisin family serine protease